MERKPPTVKPRRPYDSTRRREQARRTRDAILGAARARFLEHGFSQTTIASIAADAAVSVDSIYKSFGGKPGLVRAICEQALAGAGPVPAETRSDQLQVTEPDPRKIVRGFGRLSTEVAPRVSPILLLMRDAAVSDPEIAALRAELDDQRLERMRHNAANLANAGHLRRGVSIDRAAELMWTYASPELYELLVLSRRWSVEDYGDFIADALIAALL